MFGVVDLGRGCAVVGGACGSVRRRRGAIDLAAPAAADNKTDIYYYGHLTNFLVAASAVATEIYGR